MAYLAYVTGSHQLLLFLSRDPVNAVTRQPIHMASVIR